MARRPAGRLFCARETDRKKTKRQPTPDTSRYRTTPPFTHRHTSDLLNSSSADLTSLIKELINPSKETDNWSRQSPQTKSSPSLMPQSSLMAAVMPLTHASRDKRADLKTRHQTIQSTAFIRNEHGIVPLRPQGANREHVNVMGGVVAAEGRRRSDNGAKLEIGRASCRERVFRAV